MESKSLVSTTAAEACFNTINELRFRERKKLTSADFPGTFQSTSGGESPA